MYNSEDSYGGPSKALHWIVLLAMIGMSVVGFYFSDMPRGDEKTAIMKLHASTGLFLFALMAVRLYLKAKGARVAPIDPSATRLNRIAASVHHLLYLLIFFVIGAGMFTILTTGTALPFFGVFEIASPFEGDRDLHHLFEDLHKYGWWVLTGFVSLHLVGALYHHFKLGDGTLGRMWFAAKDDQD